MHRSSAWLPRDLVLLALSLAAIALLLLLGSRAAPDRVAAAELARHEGDLVALRGTVAGEPSPAGGAVRFALRDATGSAAVRWERPGAPLHAGDAVLVEGRVVWSHGRPEVWASRVEPLDAARLPRLRLDELAADPARYVGLRVVLSAQVEPGEGGAATLSDGSGERRLDARLEAPVLAGWADLEGALRFDAARFRYRFDARG